MAANGWILFLLFATGLAVGSFIGAASWRIPRGLSLVMPGSACPSCRFPLEARDLIPVVSYVLSRGRCRHCGGRISLRYPLIELVTAAGITAMYFASASVGEFVASAVFFCFLVLMSVIDLEHMLLPDRLNLAAGALGFVFAFLGVTGTAPASAVAGAAGGFGVIALIRWLSKGGMGLGDAKFLAAIGVYLGPGGAVAALLTGSVIGAAIGLALMAAGKVSRRSRLPFGPFLAAGALVVWVVRRSALLDAFPFS